MVELVYRFDDKSYRKSLKRLVDRQSMIKIILVHKHVTVLGKSAHVAHFSKLSIAPVAKSRL